jgi:hypothetical protein
VILLLKDFQQFLKLNVYGCLPISVGQQPNFLVLPDSPRVVGREVSGL